MTIRTVTLVGASGTLGPAVLNALLAADTFEVTVLVRASSKATFLDKRITTKTLPDDLDDGEPADVHARLVELLRGQDAVVLTVPGSAVRTQYVLADAAAAAGVRRFIPADYGSVDSTDGVCVELVPLYGGKAAVREHLRELAATSDSSPIASSLSTAAATVTHGVSSLLSSLIPSESGEGKEEKEEGGAERTQQGNASAGFSWTSLVCGHFFDHGLATTLLGIDVKRRTAKLFDGGNARWSASTTRRIGRAVAAVLAHEEATRNRMLYVQSFCVSQREVLQAWERVTGRRIEGADVESRPYLAERKKSLATGGGDPAVTTEELVGVLGLTRANWEGKLDFANALLELEPESLDEVVKQVYEELELE